MRRSHALAIRRAINELERASKTNSQCRDLLAFYTDGLRRILLIFGSGEHADLLNKRDLDALAKDGGQEEQR